MPLVLTLFLKQKRPTTRSSGKITEQPALNTNSEPKFEPSATIAQARSGSTAKRTNMTRLQPPFEWDDWEQAALKRGLDKDLATLGRAVMREAIGHAWSP